MCWVSVQITLKKMKVDVESWKRKKKKAFGDAVAFSYIIMSSCLIALFTLNDVRGKSFLFWMLSCCLAKKMNVSYHQHVMYVVISIRYHTEIIFILN